METWSYSRRFVEIVAALFSYLWQAGTRLKGDSPALVQKRAILFRETLEKLGSVFVKFGQFLSLRPDFISPEYCRELFYLLEKVPPFPFEEAVKIFKEDFNSAPEEVFSIFKSEPVAAASFGQVHEAHLKTGEKLAVKIQRPGIKERVKKDIRIMKVLARMADILPPGPNKIYPLVKQFENWTLEELDYLTEADYTEEFYGHYIENQDKMVVPKIYRNLCSSRVLAMEFIEGISLANILLARRNKDRVALEKLETMNFSPEKTVEILLKNSLKQIYLDGFFHADPHPANVIFMPDARLAYIDFGIVGRLDKKSRFSCLKYIRSVCYGDTTNAFEALVQLCDTSRVKNLNTLKKEHDQIVLESLEQFKMSREKGDVGGLRQIIGKKLFRTMQILQKYHVVAPPDTLRYFRALSTLDSTIVELNPEIEIETLAREVRNISIANLLKELPSLLTVEKFEENLLKWLNIIEKEIS
jgi:ubiquinone biosynthesis protein